MYLTEATNMLKLQQTEFSIITNAIVHSQNVHKFPPGINHAVKLTSSLLIC